LEEIAMSKEQRYITSQATQHTYQPKGTLRPSRDLVEYLRLYASEKPKVTALWCFGIGFVLGWKLKPW
jgi:hypothetical protein